MCIIFGIMWVRNKHNCQHRAFGPKLGNLVFILLIVLNCVLSQKYKMEDKQELYVFIAGIYFVIRDHG